jgi:hypothetical protein
VLPISIPGSWRSPTACIMYLRFLAVQVPSAIRQVESRQALMCPSRTVSAILSYSARPNASNS